LLEKDDDYIEDGSQYLDEDEIDDELGLPPELLAQGLSLDEKRRFYRFKKSHANVIHTSYSSTVTLVFNLNIYPKRLNGKNFWLTKWTKRKGAQIWNDCSV
jgi:hypothetical protein